MSHARIVSAQKNTRNFVDMVTNINKSTPAMKHKRDVTHAEAIMCELIAGLNLPLAVADEFSRHFKQMFPDFRIAAGNLLDLIIYL